MLNAKAVGCGLFYLKVTGNLMVDTKQLYNVPMLYKAFLLHAVVFVLNFQSENRR